VSRLARLLTSIRDRSTHECLVHQGQCYTYGDLEMRRVRWLESLAQQGIDAGAVVAVQSDYSLDSIALLLALWSHGCIVALLPREAPDERLLLEDACASAVIRLGAEDSRESDVRWEPCAGAGTHALIEALRERQSPGFVIFSSGSTGRAKAVLHEVDRFLSKFDRPGKPLRTVVFLLFDHIAGMDTLLYGLCAGGMLALPERRDPHHVCSLIERHRLQVLPTSPSFLRLMLLGGAHREHDLSSLEIVTYGSEAMDPTTLGRLSAAFPNARILQKYGTSELGSPRSRSRGASLWMELAGGEGDAQAEVRDGVLWLRSPAAMLGYLNAPDPFDGDGWYSTGDLVERDGNWIRILGRASELINVGGEKVFPQEVEEVILELPFVRAALVCGVAHPLLGHAVHAKLEVDPGTDVTELRKLVRQHCLGRLARYKVPVQVVEALEPIIGARQKKLRH